MKNIKKGKIKLQLILFLIFIAILIGIYTLARYVITKQDVHIQEPEEFYFNSSVLNETSPIYYAKDWNGEGTYVIAIDLNNYEDALRNTSTDINYEVSVQTNNPKVTVTVSEQTGIIYSHETTKTVNINLSVNNNCSLLDGENIQIIVQVNSTLPYAKHLIGTFNICKTSVAEYKTSLIDNVNNDYAILSITTNEVTRPIIINYDITKSTVDTTNSVFNNVSITDNSTIILNLESNKNYKIEFIKKFPENVLILGTDIILSSGN